MTCEEMATALATIQASLAALTDAYNTAAARTTATLALVEAAMIIANQAVNDESNARNALDQARGQIAMYETMMQMMNCPMPGSA